MRKELLAPVVIPMMATALFLTGCSRGENPLSSKESYDIPTEGDDIMNAQLYYGGDDEEQARTIDLSFGATGSDCYVTYRRGDETVVEDKKISGKDADYLESKLIKYSKTVRDGENGYWPDTDEYPAMISIFSYRLNFLHGNEADKIDIDGATGMPSGYEEFFSDLEEKIITAEDAASKEKESILDRILRGDVYDTDDNFFALIDEIGNSDSSYYAFADVDSDGVEEICVKRYSEMYIIDSFDNVYKIVYDGATYDMPIDEDGLTGIFYSRPSAAPTSDTYIFRTISSEGEIISEDFASWYDANENGQMDEEDCFFLDSKEEKEVTMSEWLDKAEKYQKYRDYSPWNG